MTAPTFSIWFTGLPASGKTTLANLLAQELAKKGIRSQVLDSDNMRKILTPDPAYTQEERDWFYNTLSFIGGLLVTNGVNTIISATAHRRDHRERAREYMPEFIEVYVRCPLQTCIERDQKGIYRKAVEGKATSVPGVQELYEEPTMPAIIVDTEQNPPSDCLKKIVDRLIDFGHVHE